LAVQSGGFKTALRHVMVPRHNRGCDEFNNADNNLQPFLEQISYARSFSCQKFLKEQSGKKFSVFFNRLDFPA
jgi:hypothetical protein